MQARERVMDLPRATVRTTIMLLAVVTAGCGGDSVSSSPTAPTTIAPVATGPSVMLTGRVTDASGAGLSASVGANPLRWTQPWTGPPRSTLADATGLYRFVLLPQHPGTVYVRAWKEGFVQQCAQAVTLHTDTSIDITIVPFTNALTSGLPTAPHLRHVSGVVYEKTGIGRRPLAGVWVGWEPIMDTVVADTRTDAQGRYRLCGLPRERIDSVFAVRIGTYRPVMASVEAGGDAVIDFELP
jgi:Carboxypeptidase regulatory-like domain